jgi:hypothetical protein
MPPKTPLLVIEMTLSKHLLLRRVYQLLILMKIPCIQTFLSNSRKMSVTMSPPFLHNLLCLCIEAKGYGGYLLVLVTSMGKADTPLL